MAQSPHLPTVRVLAGLSGPTIASDVFTIGDPVRGRIGVGKIGDDDIWVDITAYVRTWSFRRGAARGTNIDLRYEAGTLMVELNDGDRRFDPTNLAGPYASGGETTLLPMRRVRLIAEWAGIAYPLITALADDWQPDHSQPTWTVTTLTATDAFKVFTGTKRAAGGLVGAGEDSGARVNRVLDSLDWPTEDRDVDTGKSNLQATSLSGGGLDELQLVQDSELGEFYVDARGLAVFRNRDAPLKDARSNTAQAVFGDAGISAGEIPYKSVVVNNDDATLVNRATVTISGGTDQTAEDATSQARYLVKDYSKSGLLLQANSDALSYAKKILADHLSPGLRFDQIQVGVPTPLAADATWPALLARELGDRITVIRRPPGGGDPIERDCWVRGVEMTSNGETWTTSLQLEGVSRTNYFTIGHPTLGRIGSNAIAF